MTTPEVLLLIFAIVLLGLSFILVDKDKKTKKVYQDGMDQPELSEDDIRALKDKMRATLEDEVSNAVIDAEEKMSKISNEKIMAVNDFSIQLLEKIEQNNNEVIFLYNMMTQKEEDIKTIFTKMETIRRENKEFLERVTTLMASKNRGKDQATKKDGTTNELSPTTDTKNEKDETSAQSTVEDDGIMFIEEAAVSAETAEYTHNDEILRLHKEKKTILEISKILNIGQGEVKLVIDLYAKK